MYVVTDGRKKWIGAGKVNTGRGAVDPENPPEWARVFPARLLDLMEKFERGPQVMHLKDIGAIIAGTGVSSGWTVVEGGSGSGFLTSVLASIVQPGKVYSYEISRKFQQIARKNVELAGLSNVVFRQGSVFEFEEEADLVVFDLPNPWEGVERVKEKLRPGGYFVSYLPTANQVLRWMRSTRDFFDRRVLQVTELEWRLKEDAFRPRSKTLAHTAFICIARKV